MAKKTELEDILDNEEEIESLYSRLFSWMKMSAFEFDFRFSWIELCASIYIPNWLVILAFILYVIGRIV